MNRLARFVAIIFLISGSVVGAYAVGKTTIDPNTPEARQEAVRKQASKLANPMLDKNIAYEAVDLLLSQVLPHISVVSGVKMLPSSSRENWRVRQSKAIVFINDCPVKEFKNGIALLFGYRWSCIDPDNKEKRYVLRDTLESQCAWLDGLNKRQEEAWKQRANGIDSALVAAEKARNVSPEELAAAREDDPYLHYLASDSTGRIWSQVLQQIPEYWWQSAAEGTNKYYMADNGDIPDGLAILIEDILAMPESATATISWVPPYVANAESRSLPIAAISVSAGDPNNRDSAAASIRVLCQSKNGQLDAVEHFPVGLSSCPGCFLLGKQAMAMEEGENIDVSFNVAFDALRTDYSELTEKNSQVEEKPDKDLLREIDHSPIPKYDADGKMIDEIGLARQLRGLAKETGYTILVETFDRLQHEGNTYKQGGFPPARGTIYDVIKGITLGLYDFEKKGNLLLFRPKGWQQRRALEVNKDKIKQWENLAKAQGGLLFYDMLDVVQNTTFDQIEKTLMANSVLREAGIKNIRFSLYGILRLISLLPNNNTRTTFCSEMGLPAGVLRQLDLSEEQLKPYEDMMHNESDRTFFGVIVRDLGRDNEEGQQEVMMFVRRGSNVEILESHLILPDFQAQMVHEMLKLRQNPGSKAQME